MKRAKTYDELLDENVALRRDLAGMRETENHSKEVESKLRAIEHRYTTLTANLPLGIYRRTPGPEGKLVMVNPALVQMFGYDSVQELNQVPVARLYYDPSERERFSQKVFEHQEVITELLKMKRKDGQPIWMAVTATVICDDSGEPAYFDGIMEDVTARLEAEKEALEQQQQLLQADKMISLGVLVSGVAHEINNPNQFIVSHLAPLRRSWNDARPILDRYYDEHGDFVLGGQRYSLRRDRVPEMFENIAEGAARIRRIVDELRDYARENPEDSDEPVSLNEIVRSALSLLDNLVKKSADEFFVNYGKRLPQFKGNYQRIEQVLINLLQNSCQALDSTGGKISVATEYDSATGLLVVQIDDTGCGISPGDLSRITDPFFTTKRARGGTGLGLSISETIVAKHHGRLEFFSEPGQGTTVKMYLPAMTNPEGIDDPCP